MKARPYRVVPALRHALSDRLPVRGLRQPAERTPISKHTGAPSPFGRSRSPGGATGHAPGVLRVLPAGVTRESPPRHDGCQPIPQAKRCVRRRRAASGTADVVDGIVIATAVRHQAAIVTSDPGDLARSPHGPGQDGCLGGRSWVRTNDPSLVRRVLFR